MSSKCIGYKKELIWSREFPDRQREVELMFDGEIAKRLGENGM